LINDRQFWINVEQLQNLITPVKRAVKDIEFQGTILADVFIKLVKIAIAVQEISALISSVKIVLLYTINSESNLISIYIFWLIFSI
jgi:hypothetical protein